MLKKYLNPITLEAELFLESFEILSVQYPQVDKVLLNSLCRVIDKIDTFLNAKRDEIVGTKQMPLMRINRVKHIQRKYLCRNCSKRLDSEEALLLHVTEQCTTKYFQDRRTSGNKPNPYVCIKNFFNESIPKSFAALNTVMTEQVEQCLAIKKLSSHNKIERDLLDLIQPLYPNKTIKIYKFGSRMAGIGNENSDLDIYIDIDNTFDVFNYRANAKSLEKLHTVAKSLRYCPIIWRNVIEIVKTRVPIVNVTHAATKIKCDLNFSSSLGYANTQFLDYIFDLQPIAKYLCLVMKMWIGLYRMHHDINTYSTSLMAIFYLQTINLLPSMERLQKDISSEDAKTVGDWLYSYNKLSLAELGILKKPVDGQNLFQLITGFFQFCIDFKFDENIICPYLGKIIKKTDIHSSMPDRFVQFTKRFPKQEASLSKSVVVQDPIELYNNTAKNVTTLMAVQFYMIRDLKQMKKGFPDVP